jgi:hypothetical protein
MEYNWAFKGIIYKIFIYKSILNFFVHRFTNYGHKIAVAKNVSALLPNSWGLASLTASTKNLVVTT